MKIATYQSPTFIIGEQRPFIALVKDSFFDPTGSDAEFSLFRVRDRSAVIDHAAATISDITERLAGYFKTGYFLPDYIDAGDRQAWTFWLQYDFDGTEVLLPGEYFWQFSLSRVGSLYHAPRHERSIVMFYEHPAGGV